MHEKWEIACLGADSRAQILQPYCFVAIHVDSSLHVCSPMADNAGQRLVFPPALAGRQQFRSQYGIERT